MKRMSKKPEPERHLPTRMQALVFLFKSSLLKIRRALIDLRNPISSQKIGQTLVDAPVAGDARSDLWTHASMEEFPLTAGKVQNLRVACAALHGLEFPANAVFSFWKQMGRVTRRKGYVSGRELREGCLVATTGGGLCQLSNLLYSAALDAGFEIVERHPHSRLIPGSQAEQDRDATVFWNYVDLRFRAPYAYRLEATLTADQLSVRFRAARKEAASGPALGPSDAESESNPTRSNVSGDCHTCGEISCFRHPSTVSDDQPATGHTGFLLDEYWPEFQEWCENHNQPNDRWFLPLDGERWKKPNYAWSVPDRASVRYATLQTLRHSLRSRRLPAQGAVRQRALLLREENLAAHYAAGLDPKARHLIVSQNLLPHLWKNGHLAGRTFDVLMTRWPIVELQRLLDTAAHHDPLSSTLTDFRAEPEHVRAETEALSAAARVVTPHRAIAGHFGAKAILLEWVLPMPEESLPERHPNQLYFPASPLGRKGIFELAEALRGFDGELLVLGRAREEGADPLASVSHRPGLPSQLLSCAAVVLPAWVEHQPRLALRALANGVPVVASSGCGLPDHPQLFEIERPAAGALQKALSEVLTQSRSLVS